MDPPNTTTTTTTTVTNTNGMSSDGSKEESTLFAQFRLRKENKEKLPPNYAIENKFLERKGNFNFKVALCEMQGRRETMEDAHTIVLDMNNHKGCGFFAVFDGHDGSHASKYCSKHLWKKIDSCLDFSKEAIVSKFVELDDEVVQLQSTGGSTATFVIVNTNKTDEQGRFHVTVGNLGDSRSYVGRISSFASRSLTVDHKPTLPEENTRIVEAGGQVLRNRIDSSLGVSRAFGDAQYKKNTELPKHKQKVIPIPDVTETFLSKDEFLFVCCDGIFETFKDDAAVHFIHERLQQQSLDPSTILSDLLTATLKGGSKDNMTAMLVFCDDGTSYGQQQEQFIPGKYYTSGNETFLFGYRLDCENHGLVWADIEKTLPRPYSEDSETAGGGGSSTVADGGGSADEKLSARSQPSLVMPEKIGPVTKVGAPPRFGTQSYRNLGARVSPALIQQIDEKSKASATTTSTTSNNLDKIEEGSGGGSISTSGGSGGDGGGVVVGLKSGGGSGSSSGSEKKEEKESSKKEKEKTAGKSKTLGRTNSGKVTKDSPSSTTNSSSSSSSKLQKESKGKVKQPSQTHKTKKK